MTSKIGLRERKRMQAMRRIQEAAVDLFDERGFENVTIEQIAEAAEVSPSSVYRYFGTKEQVVLRDEYEPQFFEAVEAELVSHPPVEALRRALSQIMTDYFSRDEELARRRTRYFLEEPSLRAAWTEQVDQFVRAVADALASSRAGYDSTGAKPLLACPDHDRSRLRPSRPRRTRARDPLARRAERRPTSTVDAGGRSVDVNARRRRQRRQRKHQLSRQKLEAL